MPPLPPLQFRQDDFKPRQKRTAPLKTGQIQAAVRCSVRVSQGTQIKASPDACDSRQVKVLKANSIFPIYPIRSCNPDEIKPLKAPLNRDKPGYSGIKSKNNFGRHFLPSHLISGHLTSSHIKNIFYFLTGRRACPASSRHCPEAPVLACASHRAASLQSQCHLL